MHTFFFSSLRRRAALTAALLAALSLAAPAVAQAPAAETPWEDLMPKGWDPMEGLKLPNNAGMLNDSDPRLLDLMNELRARWDQAPTRAELDGKPVRLSGYVVPLEQAKGEVSEFLLVPYFGACIHTPPPPANQIVHVLPAKGGKGLRTMDVVTVQGKLRTARGASAMGASGYRMEAAAVEAYVAPPAQ